ncbi:sigma-54 interaction domain-containing protein [Paludibaculum fermentans]|uniref:sigma-54 interaction domain-containing protein n=1 Tax=Paludibaculum fermentans TaxID=1473598 RepID=UPI003EB8581D
MSQKLPPMICRSAAFRNVLRQVDLVAPTEETVLIEGETGTGKEVIAGAIHELSPRCSRPLLKLNCAAIPSGLLESELFGHERGAFTGALSQRVGRFESADQGTLFLDEIGDIPLDLQPKLLRVLQEQEFERLGSNRTVQCNVRIVAATNRNLAKMVAEGTFRADLYYRLSIFPIQLPPLRHRREDVPALVRHFVEDYAQRMNKQIDVIPQPAIDAMQRHAWPGNIRELQNFIARAVILTSGHALEAPLSELLRAEDKIASEPTTLEEAERSHILRILGETNGRLAPAAKILGVPRTTLFYKVRRLGIDLTRTDLGQWRETSALTVDGPISFVA